MEWEDRGKLPRTQSGCDMFKISWTRTPLTVEMKVDWQGRGSVDEKKSIENIL